MSAPVPVSAVAPIVILGAGYAGLTVAQQVSRRTRGRIPLVVVDRHPVHVLRTELYEVGRLAEAGSNVGGWIVPLTRILERRGIDFVQGTVESIDLASRRVKLDTREVPYGMLAICLGNVAAHYGIPGAGEHTYQVYRLSGAQKLAAALRDVERASSGLPGERRPRVVIIGGGSTGTELAAEIATTDWTHIAGALARPPDVILLTGSSPFLAGFLPHLVAHARKILRRSGVTMIHGLNVTRVEPNRVFLEDGSVLACDIAVWSAGLEAPPAIRALPVAHGKGGRIAVDPTLEVPGFPGVFAVGDVVEFRDPTTGMYVPGTAQAALAEARVAAVNVVARAHGDPMSRFTYRERGVVVALGLGQAAGSLRRVTIWGSPAALLKHAVEWEYSRAVEKGETPSLI